VSGRIPLLLLPGLLCDERLYAAQVAGLSDRADTVVGEFAGAESLGEMAERVLQQAPAAVFALAGLSLGGYVAFEILRRAPERVARLALLDTTPDPDGARQRRSRLNAIARAGEPDFERAMVRLMHLLIHPDRLSDRSVTGVLDGMARSHGVDVFVRHQRAILARPDSRPLLPTLRMPTLVLCGRQDRITRVALHEDMAATIPGATLAVVEDCGHLSALEQPAAVTAHLRRWLAS